MIPGVTELSCLFDVLVDLEVVDDGIDIGNAANYAIAYSGGELRIEESGEFVEEVPTGEEADIIYICEHGVMAWMNRFDSILLGEEDE